MQLFDRRFINVWTSYATYYFGKVNLSLIIPILIATMGMSKGQLGAVATGFLLAYAIGQFIHGHISERFNPFTYIGAGLLLSALMNTFLGFAGGVFFLLFFGEVLDGFFQSMGWSSCVRATSLIYKNDKATCALGTSYQIGNSIAWLVTGYVIHNFSWQWGFWFAAIVMTIRGVTVLINKPDLPIINRTIKKQAKITLDKQIVLSGINLGLLNFVRYGIIIWIPTYLFQVYQMSIDKVGLNIFLIPIAGVLGTLFYNAVEKKIGREILTSIYMIFLAVVIFSFITAGSGWIMTSFLAASGFFLYGPHVFLVATVPGRKHEELAVASSTGFIDGVGYIGAMLTGVVMPWVIDISWTSAFISWGFCCLVILVLVNVSLYNKKKKIK